MLGLNQISLAVNRLLGPGDDAVLNLNFLSGTLDSRITFTRASTATRYNSSGVLETVAVNQPRFDHDPVTLAPRGLLIEEGRTNHNTNSGSLSTWADGGAASHTSTTITFTSTTAEDRLYKSLSISGTNSITISVLFSPNDSGKVVRLAVWADGIDGLGSGKSPDITIPASGIISYSWSGISNLSNVGILNGSGQTAQTLTLRTNGGVQVETGPFPTSYIPTTTTGASREQDTAVITGTDFSSWFNASEGTFVASYANAPSNIGGIFAANDSGNAGGNRIDFRSGQGQSIISSGGSQVAALLTGAATTGVVAVAYKVNDFAASLNGAAPSTDTSGAVPTSINRLMIGSADDLNYPPSGHIRYVKYYNTRKSNSELQSLTA